MPKQCKGGSRNSLILTLFGLPFLAGGCVMGYLTLRMITDHLDARSWVETPATIRKLDLESHRGSKGGTSYKAVCTYTYIFDGREYEGDRVGLFNTADNIGSWQRDTYNRLNAARRKRQTVPCYVNPSNPAEALLDRELRFWLLFLLLLISSIFEAFGLGMVGSGAYALLTTRTRPVTPTFDKSQPWLRDPRWASGRIGPKGASRPFWSVAIALFWNAIWWPFLILLPAQLAKGDHWALLALICPAIGIALAAWAVRCVIHHRKFGRSYFELRTLPGVVGERLGGEVVLIGDLASLDRIEATLKCQETVIERRGGKSRSRTETLWEQTEVLSAPALRFGEEEARLPVSFQIPHSCRPTDDEDSDGEVEWKLQVRAPAVGVDLSLEFDVPVFRTEGSNSSVGESPEVLAEDEGVLTDENPPPLARIRREQDAYGNSVFVASAWPGLGTVWVLLAFCAVCTGTVVYMVKALSKGFCFAIPFLMVFGLFSLLLWAVLFSFLGSYHITAGQTGLTILRRFGPFSTRKTLRPEDFAGFSLKQSISSNSRQWYAVYVKPTTGKKVKLASAIEGRTAARWLIRQLEEATTEAAQSSK